MEEVPPENPSQAGGRGFDNIVEVEVDISGIKTNEDHFHIVGWLRSVRPLGQLQEGLMALV